MTFFQEELPWVRITLNKKSFMSKIWIINRQDCCFAKLPQLHIELRNTEQTREATCKVYDWIKQQKRLLICEPTIMATSLTIFAKGADKLTLCEVLVTSAGIYLISYLAGQLSSFQTICCGASVTSERQHNQDLNRLLLHSE